MRNPWRRTSPILLHIIPQRIGATDLQAMEAMLQAMVIAASDIVSCELVSDGAAVRFLIRCASEQMALQVQTQVLAHYPLSHITIQENDPLALQDGEEAQGVEVRFTGASYLSLRTWHTWHDPRRNQQGVDPLLGVLQTLTPLPEGVRMGTQVIFTPAPDRWSQGQEHHADQHTLTYKHHRETLDQRDSSSGSMVGPLVLIGGGLLLWWLVTTVVGPKATGHWIGALLAGHPMTIPWKALLAHIPWGSALLLALAGISLLGFVAWVKRGFPPVYDMRAVMEKTSQPGYFLRLRVVAIGPEHQHAAMRNALIRVASSYRILSNAGGLTWSLRHLPRWRVRHLMTHAQQGTSTNALGWQRGMRPLLLPGIAPMIASIAEIVSLWHFPHPDDIPQLADVSYQSNGRMLPAPQAVRVPATSPWCLGVSRYAGRTTPVGLSEDALRRHMLLLAKTGKGKSSLLFHLAQMTMRLPLAGLMLLDPHGDLVDLLVQSIPEQRSEDVALIDLADTEHPIGYNPLDASLGRSRDKAIENMLAIFADVWESGWGYRMENALSYALKTLYDANERMIATGQAQQQFTLLDVEPLFQRAGFRRDVLALIDDPVLVRWWKDYYEHLPPNFQTEIINPVLTKMAVFSGSRIARRILGQPQCTVNFRTVIANSGIILIKTARSQIGEATSRLIGSSLLGMVRVALEEQGEVMNEQRRRFLCLVDEFQTLQGVNFGAMLAELRKFGATFVLATQALTYLDKLDPTLRATVMSNIDALFAFAMSAEDAKLMVPELGEMVTVRDLIDLPDYSCYVKMTVEHQRIPTFSVDLDPPVFVAGSPEMIRERTHERYASHTQEEVDAIVQVLQCRWLPRARKDSPSDQQEILPREEPLQINAAQALPRIRGGKKKKPPIVRAETYHDASS